MTSGEAQSAQGDQPVESSLPKVVTAEHVKQKTREVEATYSRLMDEMIEDSKTTGFYFATFGEKTSTGDNRVLVFKKELPPTTSSGKSTRLILSRIGPIRYTFNADAQETWRINYHIKEQLENYPGGNDYYKHGGLSGQEINLIFNTGYSGSNNPDTIISSINLLPHSLRSTEKQKDDVVRVNPDEELVQLIKENRDDAVSPKKNELNKETVRLTQAQNLLDSFNSLRSLSPTDSDTPSTP